MTFVLSKRSLNKLAGVKKPLYDIVTHAIKVTPIDFAVTCGLRTEEEQQVLFDQGKTQTMNSRHLTGDAVDIAVLIDGNMCWDIERYCEIADVFRSVAFELNTSIRWGGAWSVDDITCHPGDMRAAMEEYKAFCRKKRRKIFLDGPHFELS